MFEIEITKEDIENGIEYDCTLCPLALAIKRKYPKEDISVSNPVIWIGVHMYWAMPKTQVFIRRYDRGFFVQPGIYHYRRKN